MLYCIWFRNSHEIRSYHNFCCIYGKYPLGPIYMGFLVSSAHACLKLPLHVQIIERAGKPWCCLPTRLILPYTACFFLLKSCTRGPLSLPDETPSNKATLSSLSLRWTNTPYTGQESFACLLDVNIKWNSTWLGKSAEKLKSKIEPSLAIIPNENGKTLPIISRYKGSVRMDTMQTEVSLFTSAPSPALLGGKTSLAHFFRFCRLEVT